MIMFYDREEVIELIHDLLPNDEYDMHSGMEVYIHPDVKDVVLDLNKFEWLLIYQAYPERFHMIFDDRKSLKVKKSLEEYTSKNQEFLATMKLKHGTRYFDNHHWYGLEPFPWNSLDLPIFDSNHQSDMVNLLKNIEG